MNHLTGFRLAVVSFVLLAGLALVRPASVSALVPPPGPSDGTIGVEGSIPAKPPTQGATIVSPASGQAFSSGSATVSGYCPGDLLVRVYNNDIFVGSAVCKNNSYSLQVQLFNGKNSLVSRVFDALDQEGPKSNSVDVTFTDAQYAQFGTHVQITSPYARRGALPGTVLTWPLALSGGVGPYALSVDWGDGNPAELKSIAFAGDLTLTHKYTTASTYSVLIRVTDKNGTTAFLQVIAVISGTPGTNAVGQTTSTGGTDKSARYRVLWAPAAITLLFIPITFWLGQRYELASLRKRIERDSQL